ncbi:MAG: RnfABCDGE type electron transport complex subunit B [Burkholderiaceae bacterium]
MAAGALASLAQRLHAALPQTQCTRCGYPDCAGYAQAMADGTAAINQCPPGGAEGIRRLAALMGQPALPLSPEHGSETARQVMFIDEDWCIGCTLCISACPTDAIVGSAKRMHSVIEAYCTGCELCLPVCPVDCIVTENATGEATGWNAWSPAQAAKALERYEIRSIRGRFDLGKQPISPENQALEADAGTLGNAAPNAAAEAHIRQNRIAQALARAKRPKQGPQ